MNSYWDGVWRDSKVKSYKKYINFDNKYEFIEYFKKEGLISICDVACGFGKYSSCCKQSYG